MTGTAESEISLRYQKFQPLSGSHAWYAAATGDDSNAANFHVVELIGLIREINCR